MQDGVFSPARLSDSTGDGVVGVGLSGKERDGCLVSFLRL